MTLATGMSTTWTGRVDSNWFNPANWSNGLPVPGDAVTLAPQLVGMPDFIGAFSHGLQLSAETVASVFTEVRATWVTLANVTWTDTTGASGFSSILASDAQFGRGTFVGVNPASPAGSHMVVIADSLDNHGTIGAAGPGLTEITSGSFDNAGTILATGGGTVSITASDIHADRGAGTLLLGPQGAIALGSNTTVEASEHLLFGGETASRLEYDPSAASFAGAIYGFARTDAIELDNFAGAIQSIVSIGTGGPTVLTLAGNSASSGPETVSLHFAGNVSHAPFSAFTVTDPTNGHNDTVLQIR